LGIFLFRLFFPFYGPIEESQTLSTPKNKTLFLMGLLETSISLFSFLIRVFFFLSRKGVS